MSTRQARQTKKVHCDALPRDSGAEPRAARSGETIAAGALDVLDDQRPLADLVEALPLPCVAHLEHDRGRGRPGPEAVSAREEGPLGERGDDLVAALGDLEDHLAVRHEEIQVAPVAGDEVAAPPHPPERDGLGGGRGGEQRQREPERNLWFEVHGGFSLR